MILCSRNRFLKPIQNWFNKSQTRFQKRKGRLILKFMLDLPMHSPWLGKVGMVAVWLRILLVCTLYLVEGDVKCQHILRKIGGFVFDFETPKICCTLYNNTYIISPKSCLYKKKEYCCIYVQFLKSNFWFLIFYFFGLNLH